MDHNYYGNEERGMFPSAKSLSPMLLILLIELKYGLL